MSSKRLAVLEKMVASGSKDPFAWYGLALEYSGLERFEEALDTFTKLRAMEPAYVPMYLMCGTMLVQRGQVKAGREWLGAGVEAARAKGDNHALSELMGALATAPSE